MKKRIIIIVMIVFVVLAALLALLPRFVLRSERRSPERAFVRGNSEAARQYMEYASMEEMDMRVLEIALQYPTTLPGVDWLEEFDLPADVVYYTISDGKREEAFRLKRGTKVCVGLASMPYGRGLYSLPTHQKGWRYVKPFQVSGEEADDAYYYVKLSALEKVSKALCTRDSGRRQYIEVSGYTVKEASYLAVRGVDNLFFNKGIFDSLDW